MQTMQKQISIFMASRKRALNNLSRKFPKFHEGMSTAQYVREYYARNLNAMGCESGYKADMQNANRIVADLFAPLNWAPAAMIEGDEVVCEAA